MFAGLDNFSALVIYVALRALALEPRSGTGTSTSGESDKLLFHEQDFADPASSQLYAELAGTPDAEIRGLTFYLFALARGRLADVPPIGDVRLWCQTLEELLHERDWESAVQLALRLGPEETVPGRLAAALDGSLPPSGVPPAVGAAIAASDDWEVARNYVPELIDDLADAAGLIAAVRQSLELVPLFGQLDALRQSGQWQEFTQLWKRHAAQLAGRPAADPFGWNPRSWTPSARWPSCSSASRPIWRAGRCLAAFAIAGRPRVGRPLVAAIATPLDRGRARADSRCCSSQVRRSRCWLTTNSYWPPGTRRWRPTWRPAPASTGPLGRPGERIEVHRRLGQQIGRGRRKATPSATSRVWRATCRPATIRNWLDGSSGPAPAAGFRAVVGGAGRAGVRRGPGHCLAGLVRPATRRNWSPQHAGRIDLALARLPLLRALAEELADGGRGRGFRSPNPSDLERAAAGRLPGRPALAPPLPGRGRARQAARAATAAPPFRATDEDIFQALVAANGRLRRWARTNCVGSPGTKNNPPRRTPLAAYQREISRANKACILFLLDQSQSMSEPLANAGRSKCQALADAVNSWLLNMSIRASGDHGIRDWMDVGVLGYRTHNLTPLITPALAGTLAGRSLVSIVDVANQPARIETTTQRIRDDETGEWLEVPADIPVWVDPLASGSTPMSHVLIYARAILEDWIKAAPPTVFRRWSCTLPTAPRRTATRRRMPTSSSSWPPATATFCCSIVIFRRPPRRPCCFLPAKQNLPDELARQLFRMSSSCPSRSSGPPPGPGLKVEPGPGGMAFNADMAVLVQFLEMGTRATAGRS